MNAKRRLTLGHIDDIAVVRDIAHHGDARLACRDADGEKIGAPPPPDGIEPCSPGALAGLKPTNQLPSGETQEAVMSACGSRIPGRLPEQSAIRANWRPRVDPVHFEAAVGIERVADQRLGGCDHMRPARRQNIACDSRVSSAGL